MVTVHQGLIALVQMIFSENVLIKNRLPNMLDLILLLSKRAFFTTELKNVPVIKAVDMSNELVLTCTAPYCAQHDAYSRLLLHTVL